MATSLACSKLSRRQSKSGVAITISPTQLGHRTRIVFISVDSILFSCENCTLSSILFCSIDSTPEDGYVTGVESFLGRLNTIFLCKSRILSAGLTILMHRLYERFE